MSRLGKKPITIPEKVKFDFNADRLVKVEGPKGKLEFSVPKGIDVKVEDAQITTTRASDSKDHKALHGLVRQLVSNMVVGVSTGFQKKLIINGVGYRAAVKGKNLDLTLGFSHPVLYPIPEGVNIKMEGQTTIVVDSADKQLLGQTCAEIRKYRKPEPYQGKGIRYEDEVIKRKAGKSAAAGK